MQVCEKAVSLLPAGSLTLCHLGDVQLAQFDLGVENAGICLNDAVMSYQASIAVEGKPKQSKEVPANLSEQQWWKDKQSKKQTVKVEKANATSTPAKGQQGGSSGVGRGIGQQSRGKTTTGGQGTAAGRTTGASARPTATGAARGRAATTAGRAPAVKPSASQTRTTTAATKPATTAKTATQPTRQAAVKPSTGVSKKPPPSTTSSSRSVGTPTRQPVKPGSSAGAARPSAAAKGVATLGELKSGVKTSPSTSSTAQDTKASEKPTSKTESEAKPTEELAGLGELNPKSYQSRLGLARALSRKGDEASQSESQQLYEAVISLAPHIHDAYIEVAEMLIKKDPMAAVAVYGKFPFSESPSFDDAYIHGEIVRLLIKQEQYDDPRLGPNLIAFGRVMGINSLEKYVIILDSKFKTKLLMSVYAGVHGKDVDDPDLKAFFKFKCWI